MQELIHNILHIDQALAGLLTSHGPWVYAILFAIVFAETGLVVTPFLPGDSLLFAAGALAASQPHAFNVWIVSLLLIFAAILGDAVNYAAGKWIGPRVFCKELDPDRRPSLLEKLLNRKHLDKAHAFYEKYGGKAVVIGRFVPIVRTFVPFVAGAGAMNYSKFFFYNVAGAFLWVGVCVAAGYAFGNMPIVKDNFSLVILGIIVVSVLPIAFEFVMAYREKRSPALPASTVISPAPSLEPRKSDAA
ncbi:MAG: DedA family protein [Phycisphaeraceae bacterium]|nr:DedA family protein [Phycisphaeraceae bacterium]